MKYQVTIKTGDQAPSGTNSDIKLKIIGTKGETEFCELDHFFHDDFHATSTTPDTRLPRWCSCDFHDIGHSRSKVVFMRLQTTVDACFSAMIFMRLQRFLR